MVHFEIKRNLKTFKLKLSVEEGSMLVEKRREDPLPIQLIYITSRNRPALKMWMLPMEVNIILGIKTNSSSADRGEGTDLEILLDFTKKKFKIAS